MLDTEYNNVDYNPRDPDTWGHEDYYCYWKDESEDTAIEEEFRDAEIARLANERERNSFGILFKIVKSHLSKIPRIERGVNAEWDLRTYWLSKAPDFIDFDELASDGQSLIDICDLYGCEIANYLYRRFLLARYADKNNTNIPSEEVINDRLSFEEVTFVASTSPADFKITFHLGAALRALTLAPSFPRTCLA